jgi:hypothetical protein
MNTTPPPQGMEPEWDALPTVWAVSKPKETFWLMPMRSVYSARVGATLTWGLSAVTQMQATVWNEMATLISSGTSAFLRGLNYPTTSAWPS